MDNPLITKYGADKIWVDWRREKGSDGEPTKVPYQTNGHRADTTDPTTWCTAAKALAAVGFDGIGIVFTPDKLGIDLDHVFEEGHETPPYVFEFIQKVNTYTEWSPSKKGVHAYLELSAPLELKRKRKKIAKYHPDEGYECYTEGRFFTVTGDTYEEVKPIRTVTPQEAEELLSILGYPWGKGGNVPYISAASTAPTPASTTEDAELLQEMFAATNGADIRKLWGGDISKYNNDDSAADAALCSHLAFWTSRNGTQIESMWLASPLGTRSKTQERKDYRERTIAFAIENCTETYGGAKEASHDYGSLLRAIPKDTPPESIVKALTPLLEALAINEELAQADIYIRKNIRTELKLDVKDTDSILKHFKVVRTRVLQKIAAEKKKTEEGILDAPLTEEEKNVAETILKSPTLLYDVLQMVKKLGVVGEEKNILLHYIILTSRLLKHPLSAVVKGDSAAGKSFTLLTPLKLFPKSAYIDLTDATPQSFFYTPDGYFKHRIIVIFEKHGSERADYTIRTLQSEGKLKIQVTIKNPETGQFEAQTIEKEGPTGFVTTTTASMIHGENDTRNISMFPDQSTKQTMRVYESVDARYLGIRRPEGDELKTWQHAQLRLESLPVAIPFAASFRKYFPSHIIRTRRDYGHFLAVMETSALLHQMQRQKIEVNGQMCIRATLADAHIAKIIVEESLSMSIHELPEKTVEVIEAARGLIKEMAAEAAESGDVPGDITFTVTALAKHLNWDRDTVSKWLKPAGKKGYVTQVVAGKGPKGAEYKVEDKKLPGATFLPSVLVLAACLPQEGTEGVYDPITGHIGLPEATTDVPMEEEVGINVPSSGASTTNFEAPMESIGASVQEEPVPSYEGELSTCCTAPMSDSGQCVNCGADGHATLQEIQDDPPAPQNVEDVWKQF